MGQGIEVGRTCPITDPQAFLAGCFESGVISLALGAQGVGSLEIGTGTVNGKPVVSGDGFVFGAASVFLSIVPIFVVAGTFTGLGLAKGAAEFLAGAPVIGRFSVLVHGEARIADRIANGEFLRIFCIARVERNHSIPFVNVFHQMIDRIRIVTFIPKEGTFPEGEGKVGGGEDFLNNGGIRHIGGGGQFVER